MVNPAMAVTLIGATSGVFTVLTNMLISKKTEDRLEISEGEVFWALVAVGVGSTLAYFLIRGESTDAE